MVDEDLLANHAWLAAHDRELCRKYAGKWVAVAGQRLVGVADSMKELLALPEVKRAHQPLLSKILSPDEAIFALGLT